MIPANISRKLGKIIVKIKNPDIKQEELDKFLELWRKFDLEIEQVIEEAG